MVNRNITKVISVKNLSEIFGENIVTDFIPLDNYQAVDFIVASGTGEAAEITVSAAAKSGEVGTEIQIPLRKVNAASDIIYIEREDTLSIGGEGGSLAAYRVNAVDLAKSGSDRAALKLTAAAGSTVSGCIIAVLSQARYTE